MEKKDDKIIFIDEQGRETKLNILFTYEKKEINRTYVFFFADEKPEEVIVGYLGENQEILDIEDDDEYDELDEVFNSFIEEQENQ